MISSISAISSSYLASTSPMVGDIRLNASLASTPSQPVSYSSQVQADTSKNKSSNAQFIQSKDTIQADASQTPSQNSQQPTTSEQSFKQAQMTAQVEQVVSQLKARDTEVRAHEMAHLGAAGGYSTGMSFTYQRGPDGKQYAVGGEVGIDTSAISGDPEATLAKAQIVQRAALAPAQPSEQDRKVASSAQKMMMEAKTEIAKQKVEEAKDSIAAQSDSAIEPALAFGGSGSRSISTSQQNMEQDGASFQPNLLAERGLFDTRISLQRVIR